MLKVELHAHTDIDPLDAIGYSTRELIDRAAALGYQALAVTPHDGYFDPAQDRAYAADRGIVLLPGIERTIDGSHVLLINFPSGSASVRTLDEVRALARSQPNGLVVAPHPLFPNPSALGAETLDRYADVFDAIEVSAFFTRHIDFNAPAVIWAERHAKPLVGNGDIHLLSQLGTTYSLVDAEPDPDAICAAIKAGRVRVCTTPLSMPAVASQFARKSVIGAVGRGKRFFRRR